MTTAPFDSDWPTYDTGLTMEPPRSIKGMLVFFSAILISIPIIAMIHLLGSGLADKIANLLTIVVIAIVLAAAPVWLWLSERQQKRVAPILANAFDFPVTYEDISAHRWNPNWDQPTPIGGGGFFLTRVPHTQPSSTIGVRGPHGWRPPTGWEQAITQHTRN